MGNLLACSESFIWENPNVDRTTLLVDFNLAILSAREFEDHLYIPPNFWNVEASWGQLFPILWDTGYSDLKDILFPWLTSTHYRALFELCRTLKNYTPNRSRTINDLAAEFPTHNNGIIGLYMAVCPTPYIYNLASWEQFHRTFVTQSQFDVKTNYDYFIRFYKPSLKKSAGSIEMEIKRKQCHPIIKSLHIPNHVENDVTLHNEQIHVHFNDNKGSALNIDGSWKHGSCDIHNEAKVQLISWGFILPLNQY